MRILHVAPDLAPASGGPVAVVLGLAGAQAALGHEVAIAATGAGREESPSVDGVIIRLFHSGFPPWRWSRGLGHFLARQVSGSDLVHAHTVWQYPTWAAGRACRLARVPYVLTFHGMLEDWAVSQRAWKKGIYLRLAGRGVLEHAAAVHATTDAELSASRGRIRAPGAFVVPNGLARSAYADLPPASRFGERFPALAGRRVVLFLGRLHPKKQPEIAIRAFHEACGGRKDVTLVLAGPSGPAYLRALRNLGDELGVASRIIFTGMLRGRMVQEAYRAASLFVLPSLQENFGMTVAEAMAAECPVVVSDRVGLASEIGRAGAGLVTPPTVGATAAAMARLLDDEPFRASMGRNGRRLVLERFTWERIVPDLMEVYRDILLGRRRSHAWRAPARVDARETESLLPPGA